MAKITLNDIEKTLVALDAANVFFAQKACTTEPENAPSRVIHCLSFAGCGSTHFAALLKPVSGTRARRLEIPQARGFRVGFFPF